MVQPLRTILTALCLTAMVIPFSFAQDQDSSTEPDLESASRPIEEISVVGERTFFSLRLEVESAETEVYGLFNELNSRDEFDIKCIEEIFIGSHFSKRVCMADYLRKEQARNVQNAALGIDILLILDGVKGDVSQKTLAMEAEMLSLAQENPVFFEAIRKLTELIGILQIKKEENPFFFER